MKKDCTGTTPIVGLRILSSLIARKTGISNADTKKVLKALVEVVGESIRSGAFVIIKGLFSARRMQREARRTFVPSRTGPGHYTTTPRRSYIRIKPCIPLVKGVALNRGKGLSYIKKEDAQCQKNPTSPAK